MQHVSDKDKTKAVGEMKMKIDTKFADFLKILRKWLMQGHAFRIHKILRLCKKNVIQATARLQVSLIGVKEGRCWNHIWLLIWLDWVRIEVKAGGKKKK